MKKVVYLLSLVLVLAGLVSCKEKEAEPAPAVVGRWDLNRGVLGGFASPYQQYNGVALDLYLIEAYGARIDIFADKTFNVNSRQQLVSDFKGNWEFANNKLTLKYDDGDTEEYTYAKTGNIEELSLAPVAYSLDSAGAVKGQIQVFYRK